MAQSKDIDAKSVSKQEVATIKESVGRPNQTVAAIREQARIEEEKQIKRYANAKDEKVMKTLRDISQNAQAISLTSTDKNTIKGYLTGNIIKYISR